MLKAVQSIFFCKNTKNVQYGVKLIVVEEGTWRYIVKYYSAISSATISEVQWSGGMYTKQKRYITVQNAQEQGAKWVGWDVHSAKAIYNSAKCIAASSQVD